MHDHLVVIFGLMAERRAHVEIGVHSLWAIVTWQSIFGQYFNPINGTGRGRAMWTTTPQVALTKSRKTVLVALKFHHAAFLASDVAPTQVQI